MPSPPHHPSTHSQSVLAQRAKVLRQQVWNGCQSLQGSPSELWKTYVLKFLDSYAYFSLSVIFTLFLTHDFGYSDVQAGTIYGAWGALITIYGLATGFLVDNVGVAVSVRWGFVIQLMARIVIFVTTSRTMLLWSVWCFLPLGNCLGIPVLTIGIRRYTTTHNRGFAFGLFYVVMNIAALFSGPMVDLCTKVWDPTLASSKEEGDQTDTSIEGQEENDNTPREWSLNGYRLVLLTCIIANVMSVLVSLTVREIKLVDDDDNDKEAVDGTMDNSTQEVDEDELSVKKKNQISTFTPTRGSAWSILKETLETKTFWRYLAVVLITLNVGMVFRHLDATLPKYMIREFGPDVAYGTVYSINPAMIMILVPIMTAATSQYDPLVMIHYGTYVSAASVFCLVVSTSIPACISFVIVLSIGEAIWSPRLYDYTMSVCPEGREGTYGALASAPLFLAKLPVGFLSGILLQTYCPAEGPRHSQLMWLIIACTTVTSPIFMTLCWKFVSHKDSEDDKGYTELAGGTTPGGYDEDDDNNQDDDADDEHCIT
ncbi:Major Facilitator Superfamily [Seminavis robusta]|uniref:Major Facilitator Superfamily n=1 Tax=Seminavis robusta TaxID=568900 RepID=A0A9N8DBK3_9STRA|nr:Major Facilitator Superfamily [Seminavis robusta]|eukprot:Sro45_g027160.1 Major Facilitator Superfamily (541) ;mRNA; f:128751-130373